MLRIGDRIIDPKLIVLDKDGTLIRFDDMWHAWFSSVLNRLRKLLPFSDELRAGLAGTLGYDSVSDVWDPLGPLTLASTKEVALLMAGQIYQHARLPWDDALAKVMSAEQHARRSLTSGELVQPIGNVHGWMEKARQAGHQLALATTDDRAQTDIALAKLNIAELFATTVCGDDGFALKPAPDMAQTILKRLQIAAVDAICIGDTNADMQMGKSAGLSLVIGVASGALRAEDLKAAADIVVADIHAIEII